MLLIFFISTIIEQFKLSKSTVLSTSSDHIKVILDSCRKISIVARSSHEDNEALMTHTELMNKRTEDAKVTKQAKLVAGRLILGVSQSNINEQESAFVDDVYSVDEDCDIDSVDGDYARHGSEKKISSKRNANKAKVGDAMEGVVIPAGKKAKKSRGGPNSLLIQPDSIPLSSTTSSSTAVISSFGSYSSLKELVAKADESFNTILRDQQNTPVATIPASAPKTTREKLADNESLYNDGLLTETEYKTRRQLILSSFD